jgi:parvulin-like peptidyl-prolyl isomerase
VRKALLFLVALVVLTAGACGGAGESYAAKVNGKSITQSELDDELEAIVGNDRYLEGIESQGNQVRGRGRGTVDAAFVARVLTRQILLELVHQEAERRNIDITDTDLEQARQEVVESVGGDDVFGAFPKQYQDLLVRRSAEVSKVQVALGEADVSDEAIQRFYEANAQQLFNQTCVAHILFAVTGPDGRPDQQATAAAAPQLQAEAARTKAEIDRGADFAALAAQRSKDAGNKDEGGDLECGPPGRFVPEFETAMDALQPGEVSQPVQTQFGWHLIKVSERKVQPLDEVRDEVRQRLLGESQEAFTTFLRDQVTKAKVTVNPRYGRFDPRAESPGVIPPQAPATTTTVPAGVEQQLTP